MDAPMHKSIEAHKHVCWVAGRSKVGEGVTCLHSSTSFRIDSRGLVVHDRKTRCGDRNSRVQATIERVGELLPFLNGRKGEGLPRNEKEGRKFGDGGGQHGTWKWRSVNLPEMIYNIPNLAAFGRSD